MSQYATVLFHICTDGYGGVMPGPSPGRTSPPTARVVAVLEHLASRPDRRFGVSELARRLELSKPTCLGIVTALTEAGYLVRDDADKTYRLGPTLITLGHRAQQSLRVSPAAHDELRTLAAAFAATAALSGVVDDRITVLDLVTPPGARPGVEPGQSYPFAPPVGLMFVLWDDDATRRWLAKEPTIPLRTDTDRLDRVIAGCRADGYLVERRTAAGRRLYALMAGMSATLPGELQVLLAELVSDIGERVLLRTDSADGGRHDVSVISAPVFDRDHRQVMVVSLHVDAALTHREIDTRATALVAAANAVTVQLSGAAS
jgi:DNA-binding IclR family transcriptional regulator